MVAKTDEKKADLHVRTTYSMGRVTPTKAVDLAKEQKLSAIAIADQGLPEAVAAGKFAGVEVVPAVELMFEEGAIEPHIIAYFIDWHHSDFRAAVNKARADRVKQVSEMVVTLQSLGIEITYEEVMEDAAKSMTVGRSNVANVLVKRGVVKSPKEAFEKYLGYGKPAYVGREEWSMDYVMWLIEEAGGVPALAHPKFNDAFTLLPKLVKSGLKGLEVYHFSHSPAEVRQFRAMAKKYNLVEVGGTDSEPKGPPVGSVTVPFETVEKLRKLAKATS
ncbi:MAG: hypothetical protein QXG38_04140 [Candidatus Hadarchaeales archaeon]